MTSYPYAKKSSLVFGKRPRGNFYHSIIRIVESVSEYMFLISKNNKKKQTNKKQESNKEKETKEEKRTSLDI